MKRSQSFKVFLQAIALCVVPTLAVLTLLPSCANTQVQGTGPVTFDVTIDIDVTIGPDVPHDVPGGKRLPSTEQSNVQLASFAWQQFLALCWQSDYNTSTYSRGAPDPNWNYTKPYGAGQPVVWETYAHKSELRPFGVPLDSDFSKKPTYLFGNTKLKPAGGADFHLLNNLDEDNEIGSCDVYNGSGDPATQHLVVYQAKVNQAEYDYIKDVFGKTQAVGPQKDKKGNPIPGTGGKMSKAQDANIASIKNSKKPAPSGINLPPGDNSVKGIAGEGAIEIKTAFQLVTATNKKAFEGFYQTQAIYYTADYDEKTNKYRNWQYHNGTFALLAIHINHKTKSYPDFVITSFEHTSLAKMPFEYILTQYPPDYPGSNFNPNNADTVAGAPPSSQFGSREKIIRQTGMTPNRKNGYLYPVPPYMDAVTKKVHTQLAKLNPNSVWLNYRLIGVQANITEKWAAKPSADAGPNHYMANHVVESDAFLGNFFGPGFSPTNPFPTGPKGPNGNRNGDNLLYQGKTYNMGGCKGCHGVAQTSFGTDFSFLLDFGNNKPVIDPDTIFYHPDEK